MIRATDSPQVYRRALVQIDRATKSLGAAIGNKALTRTDYRRRASIRRVKRYRDDLSML
jgi:hypothetical protein